MSKAFARNKNPRTDTLTQISYYNVLGDYVNNMNKLENIAKKKQVKASSTSTTLDNLSTDLNYLPVPSLLETMV